MADHKPAVSLEDLSARLDRIESTLSRLDHALSRVPSVVATTADLAAQATPTAAMVGDMLDDWAMRASDRGIDIDDRVRRALHLVQRLTEPEIADAVEAVLDRIAAVKRMVEQLDAMPGVIATVVDMMDELSLAAANKGLDIDTIGRTGKDVLGRIAWLMQSPELKDVLDSGIFEPRVVQVVGQIGRALSAARDEHPGQAGLLAMLRASRDPDVQRTIDFTMRFLRHLGTQLDAGEGIAIESAARKELPNV